jgi:hypothetical protein
MTFTNTYDYVRKINEGQLQFYTYIYCLGRLGKQINCDFVITQQKSNYDCQKLWSFGHTIKARP